MFHIQVQMTSHTSTIAIYSVECYCGTGKFIDSVVPIDVCNDEINDREITDDELEQENDTFTRLCKIIAESDFSGSGIQFANPNDRVSLIQIINRTALVEKGINTGVAIVTIELNIPYGIVFGDARNDMHAIDSRLADFRNGNMLSYVPYHMEFSPIL